MFRTDPSQNAETFISPTRHQVLKGEGFAPARRRSGGSGRTLMARGRRARALGLEATGKETHNRSLRASQGVGLAGSAGHKLWRCSPRRAGVSSWKNGSVVPTLPFAHPSYADSPPQESALLPKDAIHHMNVEVVSTLVAVAAAAILFAQFITTRRQRQLTELQVIHELSTQWGEVRPAWEALRVLGGDMYVAASPQAVQTYPFLTDRDEIGPYIQRAHDVKLCSSWSPSSLGFLTARARLPQLSVPEDVYRLPLEALATISAYILRGRVGPGLAYEVFGPHIARKSGTVRFITDVQPDSTYYLNYYPGVRRRVLILVDVLWAEAARVGDLEEHEMREGMHTKRRYASGVRNRVRARREARTLGGRVSALRVDWLLVNAQIPAEYRGIKRRLVQSAVWIAGFFRRYRGDLFPDASQWSAYGLESELSERPDGGIADPD